MRTTFASILTLATLHLTSASPINAPLEPRATTFNELATFDSLPTNALIPTPYKHLAWSKLKVQSTTSDSATRLVTPSSPPNYAISGPGTNDYIYTASLDLTGTTTSFDFQEFSFACLDNRPQGPPKQLVPRKCQISVYGYYEGDAGRNHPGPVPVDYDLVAQRTMKKVTLSAGKGNGGFSGLRSAVFRIVSSEVGVENTVLVVDGVKYVAYA